MFEGDPQTRVKDRDRDRAIYVIDAALRNRQISQQDHDLRADRVRAAVTIGELDGLTRDIVDAPAPMPPTAVVPPVPPPVVPAGVTAGTAPNPYDPGSAPSTGSVPADLYGPPPSATGTVAAAGVTTKPSRVGRKLALGCGLAVLLFFIAPIGMGVALFATQGDGNGPSIPDVEATPAGPPFELNGKGIRAFVDAFEQTFGDTAVVRSVFYDGYVVSWVPQGNGKVALWDYTDGSFDQLGDPMDDSLETQPVDLADLKPAKVMSLVRTAQTTLGVPEPTTTYVIYDRQLVGDDPVVTVYLTNEAGDSGFVTGDVQGNVLQTSKP